MNVTIHGPNLNDQSKGQFHVHTASCRDNRKEVVRNGSEYPITIDVDSVQDVVECMYSDIIAEHVADGDNGIYCNWETYIPEFHFAPCTNDLDYATD
jgi:hypothetical protein